MILHFQKKKHAFKHQELQSQVGWKGRLKRSLYKNNKEQLKNENNKRKQFVSLNSKLHELNKNWMRSFGKNKRIILQSKEQSQLPTFPHGEYSFYLPLLQSCHLPDELTWFFSYFNILHQKMNSKKLSIAYEEISLSISETEGKNTHKKIEQKNIEFQKVFQKCLDKYTCELDSIQKLQIYFQLQKRGIRALKQIYEEKKYKCDKDVFQTAIIRSELYFHQKVLINKNIQSFSMAQDEELNENALTKTMKMLFCPLCNIYDCARHEESRTDIQYVYQYVSPTNVISDEDLTISALKLIYQQMSIIKNKVNQCQDPCSNRCYLLLKSRESINQLQKKKVLFNISPLIKGIINLGINCFGFDPCCIWSIVELGKKTIFKVTCDIIFLYFIVDYNIMKRIQLKLKNSQQSYLKQQKKNEDINPSLYKNIKPKQSDQNKQTSKFAVCHHHYINQQPFDLGCNNCECSIRGYCRSECLCTSDCRLKKGCSCKTSQCSANRCICFQTQRQCQPGLCLYCYNYDGNIKTNKCKNCLIISNDLCSVKIGKSKIPGAGLGLFAGQNIKAKQLVYTYTGDIIETEIESIREKLSQSNDFYNFACHNETIDSRFVGNKARFINHGNEGQDNLASEIRMSKGLHVIVFYAKRDITKGEQLYFNYDGEGQLFKNHKHKYPFIKKR